METSNTYGNVTVHGDQKVSVDIKSRIEKFAKDHPFVVDFSYNLLKGVAVGLVGGLAASLVFNRLVMSEDANGIEVATEVEVPFDVDEG